MAILVYIYSIFDKDNTAYEERWEGTRFGFRDLVRTSLMSWINQSFSPYLTNELDQSIIYIIGPYLTSQLIQSVVKSVTY